MLFTFFLESFFLFYVCEYCLHMCLYTTRVPGTQGGQKKASDPLQLEFQSVAPPLPKLFIFKSVAKCEVTRMHLLSGLWIYLIIVTHCSFHETCPLETIIGTLII